MKAENTKAAVKSQTLSNVLSALGPCASFLCLVHCFGMALLATFAPSILAFLPHSDFAEASVLGFSALVGFFSLLRFRAGLPVLIVFVAIALGGEIGLFFHNHEIFRFSLLSLALAQIYYMVRHYFSMNKKPACCEEQDRCA